MYSVRWSVTYNVHQRGTMTFKRLFPIRFASFASDSDQGSAPRRLFPGRRWMAVWLAFPIAGYIGWTVGGRVDAVDAALVGGALTGAGLGAAQWWAAKGALGRP